MKAASNQLGDLEVKGRRVFVRADLNAPIADGQVSDDTRLSATLPTLRKLLDSGARVVLASHLGRPKGERKPELSLAPVAKRLESLGCRWISTAEELEG